MIVAKGSKFERDICRTLSAWWLDDADADVCFWRTAMSGGRATVRRKLGRDTNRAHCGDLGALDERGAPLTRFITFELKRGYSHAHLHALMDAPDGAAIQTYAEWIDQARESSANAKTPHWCIIHARDRRCPTVTIPGPLADTLRLYRGLVAPSITLAYRGLMREMENFGATIITSMQLSVFLQNTKPADIRRLAQPYIAQST